MAKVGADIQHRARGRPKVDDCALLGDVLVAWLRTGGPRAHGLDRAVRDIATPARALKEHPIVAVKRLRARLRRALREMDTERMMLLAIQAAEARAVAVPEWARAELAEAEQRRREWEAAFAADPGRFAVPGVFVHPQLEKLRAEADYMHRLVLVGRALDDVLPDSTPISTIARLFNDLRRAAAAAAKRTRR
jgi:hypothetical protein